jgi:hypothetical protein
LTARIFGRAARGLGFGATLGFGLTFGFAAALATLVFVLALAIGQPFRDQLEFHNTIVTDCFLITIRMVQTRGCHPAIQLE